MKFTAFGQRFTGDAGILQLMSDLGQALADADVMMLGGGNPARIPAVQERFREQLQRIANDPEEFARVIGNYDSPQGESGFVQSLADLLRQEYGWDIGPRNIALTAGSQTGFFMLFNLFGGTYPDGTQRRILLPMVPEYIGYTDVGIGDDLFYACRPDIEHTDVHRFKYHVDFNHLQAGDDIGAICISRPTNPTGNVLTDGEVDQLHVLAQAHDVPLIIDNAYGQPFPDIIFTGASLSWSDRIILCMSLSKLGLPGVRTGIIIANEIVIRAVTGMNAILQLAVGSVGPAVVQPLLATGEIIRLSREVINPYYRQRAEHALQCFDRELQGLNYSIHEAEGAIFLWLWFPGLPISSDELYQRLKRRGVLVIAGEHFFPGLQQDWQHRHECIRVSYAQTPETVERGIRIIAEEVKKA